MQTRQLAPGLSVTRQLLEPEVALAATAGFKSIISNRPDGEEAGQPTTASIAEQARRQGLSFVSIPVRTDSIGEADVIRMRDALASLPKPVLAYCRTGTRSATLWALSRSGEEAVDSILAAAAAAGYNLESLRPQLGAASPAAGASE